MENSPQKSKAVIITIIAIIVLLIVGYFLFKNRESLGIKPTSTIGKMFTPLDPSTNSKDTTPIAQVQSVFAGEDIKSGDKVSISRFDENNNPIIMKWKDGDVLYGTANQDISSGRMGDITITPANSNTPDSSFLGSVSDFFSGLFGNKEKTNTDIPSDWSFDANTKTWLLPDGSVFNSIEGVWKLYNGATFNRAEKIWKMPDGSTFNDNTGIWTFPDGSTFDSNTGIFTPSGSGQFNEATGIWTFPDGSTFNTNTGVWTSKTGSTLNTKTGVWTSPDGKSWFDSNTLTWGFSNGSSFNSGNGIWTFPDGSTFNSNTGTFTPPTGPNTGPIIGGGGNNNNSCPTGWTGTYPTCSAPTVCPIGWTGTYPTCTSTSGTGNSCPIGWTGTYPTCTSPFGIGGSCPTGWTGTYPICTFPTGVDVGGGTTTTGSDLVVGMVVPSLEVSLPTVSTSAVSSITKISAIGGGTIVSDGGSSITSSGVVWGTTANPTTSLFTKKVNGVFYNSSDAPWTSSITGLQANTTYYIRAYATNSEGTAYGPTVTFKTSAN